MNRLRFYIKKLYNKNVSILDFLFSFYQDSMSIVYFNEFTNKEKDLFNIHYAKTKWFFMKNDINTYFTYFYTNDCELVTPDFLTEYTVDSNVFLNHKSRIMQLIKSKNILIWRQHHNRIFELIYIFIYLISGKRIYNINITDTKAQEYNTYAKLPWIITSAKNKEKIIQKNYEKFVACIERIKKKGYNKSFVIANGPSLEDIFNIDVSHGYKIVANSIVKNRKMMDYIQPDFVVAGDPLWHFGPSKYSEQFRNDIVNSVKENKNLFFIFPAEQGLVNYINIPQIRNNIILIPYGKKEPNFDLIKEFYLPPFTSVINALMIPIASTLCDEIYILGSDGKVKHRPNEDFWAHAGDVQYSKDLVDCGHRCSPTFDINRKSHDEVANVENTLTQIILQGEKFYFKKFYNLSKISTFASLIKRFKKI